MRKEKNQVANQLIMMITITIITQVFLLLKNSILAANFGVGIEIDTFNFSMNISNFTFSFVGAGISSVLLPYLKEKKHKKSIDVFITIIFSLAILLAILLLIMRQPLVALLSGNPSEQFVNMASTLLFFTVISGLFNSLNTLASNILEFNDFFVRQKIVNMLSTAIAVSFLVWVTDFSVYVYAGTFVFIALINASLDTFFLRKTDFSYRVNFDVTNSTFQKMMKSMGPAIFGTGVYQLSVLTDTLIASRLPTGSISVLNFSNTIVSMVNMLILTNLTSYFYPRLVKKNTIDERQKGLSDYLLIVNALLCLIVVGFFLIGFEGIQLLYQRGSFSSNDTQLVFIGAAIYMFQLPVNGSRDLFYKYFYAEGNTLTPFFNSILVSGLNLIISLILVNIFGLYGVILGTVLASYISLIAISKKMGKIHSILFDFKAFSIEIIKILFSSAGTLIIVFLLKGLIGIQSPIISILLFGTLSVIIFVIILKIIKSKLFSIKI